MSVDEEDQVKPAYEPSRYSACARISLKSPFSDLAAL